MFFNAAATSPSATPEEMYRVHVTGTLNVMRAAAKASPNAVLVLVGSAAEYGVVAEERLPIDEEEPAQPASLFGASKMAQTQLALAAAVEWSLRVLVARPFNLLGPGLPEHYLAAALAKRLLQEGRTTKPLVVANAEATRDFVDVRDAAAALVLMIEKAAPFPGGSRIFNIASGQETSVLEIARTLCELHGRRSVLAEGDASSRSRIRRSCGDAARLRTATGWQPCFSWKESLRAMCEAMHTGQEIAKAS